MFDRVENGDCSQICDFGVALQFVDHQPRHVGLVYRDEDDGLKIAHLLAHRIFRKEALSKDGFFCANAECIGNEERRIDFHARLIAMQDRQELPYAFRFDAHCFDRDLKAKRFRTGYGLTCASFVIAVFHSVGIKIADLGSWVLREEDTAWQKTYVEELQTIAGVEYAAFVAKNIPTIRVRPAEAAACVVSDAIPVKCSDAEIKASQIIQRVNALSFSAHPTAPKTGEPVECASDEASSPKSNGNESKTMSDG